MLALVIYKRKELTSPVMDKLWMMKRDIVLNMKRHAEEDGRNICDGLFMCACLRVTACIWVNAIPVDRQQCPQQSYVNAVDRDWSTNDTLTLQYGRYDVRPQIAGGFAHTVRNSKTWSTCNSHSLLVIRSCPAWLQGIQCVCVGGLHQFKSVILLTLTILREAFE